jgi:hypothetical protein
MCTVLSRGSNVLETFVYSSVTGTWRCVASVSDAYYKHVQYLSYVERHYADGCFYWADSCKENMLVLDTNEMKFSIVRVPPGPTDDAKVLVKAEEGMIGWLWLLLRENTLHLYSEASGSANDCGLWCHDAVVTLRDSYQWFYGGAADQGYALLQGIPKGEYVAWVRSKQSNEKTTPKTNAHYFTVELQTLVAEQLCVTEFDTEPLLSCIQAFHRRLHCQVYEIRTVSVCIDQTIFLVLIHQLLGIINVCYSVMHASLSILLVPIVHFNLMCYYRQNIHRPSWLSAFMYLRSYHLLISNFFSGTSALFHVVQCVHHCHKPDIRTKTLV